MARLMVTIYFECDPNLSWVNTSRPKPQTTWEKWWLYGWFLTVSC